MEDKKIIGAFEAVSMPELGVFDVTAKIDTGAWSGALHCTDIHEADGRLFFTPLGKPELATSTTEYDIRNVRSSNGNGEDRYRIKSTVIIGGESYITHITLSDRTNMQYEILVGRKFLRNHKMIVDVSKGILQLDSGSKEEEL